MSIYEAMQWELTNTSLAGRLLPGWSADRVGPYKTQIIMCFFTAVTVFAVWLPSRSSAPIVVFAALYGFGSGAYVALLPTLIASISDIQEIGLRIGVEFGVIAFPALVSNPIGGAFISYGRGTYRDLQVWTGCVLLAGSFMFVAARASQVGLKVVVKV